MLESVRIKNYKSILDLKVELGFINIFIGENGCGKTNILEAIAMASASYDYSLNVEGLYNKGVRVTKPSLTFSSFLNKKQKNIIDIDLQFKNYLASSSLYSENVDDITAEWKDTYLYNSEKGVADLYLNDKYNLEKEKILEYLNNLKLLEIGFKELINKSKNIITKDTNYLNMIDDAKKKYQEINKSIESTNKDLAEMTFRSEIVNDIYDYKLSDYTEYFKHIKDYIIYTLNTKSLRGISNESKKVPLGLNGEGLDILISSFSKEEFNKLIQYSYFISWLKEIVIDKEDILKYENHKLGKSVSTLYFRDKFMKKKNNIFSAENANEGILHILFYLSLFISNKTPKFFGIDNIETALNPKMCRDLIKELAKLSIQNNKQALITTHNPAILDGLNLNDDNQRLFVVSRSDDGYTKVDRIKLKPNSPEQNLKLSELWMRGYLGGIPNNF